MSHIKLPVHLRENFHLLPYHLTTLYLFICNYNVIIVLWSFLGGICSIRSQEQLDTQPAASIILHTLQRMPLVVAWVTFIAFEFSVANQRLPSSIEEDAVNKPWRPLPSQRLSPESAKCLRWAATLCAISFSLCFGGIYPCLIHLATSFCYNDLAGSGWWATRDAQNAIGLVSWLFGCVSVASGPAMHYSSSNVLIAAVLMAAITSTTSIQDFRDFEGDAACGRRTFPIVVGESRARYLIATSLVAWSFGVSIFLSKSVFMDVIVCTLGLGLAYSLLFRRNRKADRACLEFWYLWFTMVSVAVF